jgi:hypothetical protein
MSATASEPDARARQPATPSLARRAQSLCRPSYGAGCKKLSKTYS